MSVFHCGWLLLALLSSGQQDNPNPLDRLKRGLEKVSENDYQGALVVMDGLEKELVIAETTHMENGLYNLACVYAMAGRTEQSLNTLELCMPYAPVSIDHLKTDSDLTSLHDLPRFQKLVADLEKEDASHNAWINGPLKDAQWLPPFQENLSDADKLYGLSQLWSEAKYNFAYFDQVPDLDWDAIYRDMIPRVLASTTTHNYYLLLMEMVAQLKDGHSNVYFPSEIYKRHGRVPFRTNLIENRVLVTAVYNDALSQMGLAVGNEIIEVNGMDAKTYAQRLRPYTSASTQQDLNNRLYNYKFTFGKRDDAMELTMLKADGTRITAKVSRDLPSNYNWQRVAFEVMDGNIGRLTINTFGDNQVANDVKALLPKIMATSGLIIDIRENGGGNTPRWLLNTLCSNYYDSRWSTRAYVPVYRVWGRTAPKVGDGGRLRKGNAKGRYQAPVALLIGASTFSAAEDFASIFQNAKRGKIFGSASGGSTGQPLPFQLPGGGRARLCSKRDEMADGTAFVGVGVIPDVVVEPTVAAVRNGLDLPLKAAMDWIAGGTK